MTVPVPLEEEEQADVVEYLESRGYKFTSIPNSTFTKSWKVKNRNREQGLRAGLPDLVCIINDNLIWIEMKRQKGGVLSQAQKDWIAALEEAGQTVRVCKGAEEAIKFIEEVEHDQS